MNEQLKSEVKKKMAEFVLDRHPCLLCGSDKITAAHAIFTSAEFRKKIKGHPEAVVYTLCTDCTAIPEKLKLFAIEKAMTSTSEKSGLLI